MIGPVRRFVWKSTCASLSGAAAGSAKAKGTMNTCAVAKARAQSVEEIAGDKASGKGRFVPPVVAATTLNWGDCFMVRPEPTPSLGQINIAYGFVFVFDVVAYQVKP